jgi:hypothetical protein
MISIKSYKMKILLSILWGLGLSMLFRQTCKGRQCIIYKSPKINNIKGNIYKYNDKCYNYETEITKCTNDAIL